ncbi:MAG: quinolinate synthase NadA [Candidatus Thorarchaeota archaeon]|nr:MAG: quinolinate synthase NadA [Candidatus Thorarchaeota archaeon]
MASQWWCSFLEGELDDLQKRILDLKKKRNAFIIAHNYQLLEIQKIADFVGDSLQLAVKSAEAKGYDLVVFCGVKFMAEMAAVLSPDIPVYIPAPEALCPLASFVSPDKVQAMKQEHPGAPVVVYVNTTAETKSSCDIVCTSSTAAEIVESLGVDKVLFGPDKNLAEYVRRQTSIEIVDIEPKGHCYVHRMFDVAQIALLKEDYPDAIVLAHPECHPEVQDVADYVISTGKMAKIVEKSPSKTFIIATEVGLVEQLQHKHPDKIILPAYDGAICIQMKKNSLEKVAEVLEDLPERNLVTVPAHMVGHIREAIERMYQALGRPSIAGATNLQS